MRSAYFWRIRSASALRFSKGCSSLNLDRMVAAVCVSDADTSDCMNILVEDTPIILKVERRWVSRSGDKCKSRRW